MEGPQLDLLNVDYQRKNGIYYTPESLATVMAEWAVRFPDDRVLDPSYGGCAMLSASMAVLSRLGATTAGKQIYGVDLDPGAWQYGSELIRQGVPIHHLVERDFLQVSPGELPQVTALIGNPPYVRHHLMDDNAREIAAQSVSLAGFSLSRRASYWAYFVLHGTRFIAPNGRMALVLPTAILQADYASEVRKVLTSQFGRITTVLVEERLFADAEEESVVVLAEGKGQRFQEVRLAAVPSVADLHMAVTNRMGTPVRDPASGHPWYSAIASQEVSELYRGIVSTDRGTDLGSLATIRIGAVTGANKFFVVDKATQDQWQIPETCVQPILSHASHLGPTLSIGRSDVDRLVRDGKRVRLVIPPPVPKRLPRGLRAYYQHGVAAGIAQRHKCESRSPWFNITDRKRPDAFLMYMSWTIPRLVINEAGVDCTNAIHRVHWTDHGAELGARAIALSMMSSIAQLGVEMFGRSYGGGVLKLEPTACNYIWLPTIQEGACGLYDEVTTLLAGGQVARAVTLIDDAVARSIGVDPALMEVLRREAIRLRMRRMRGRSSLKGQSPVSVEESMNLGTCEPATELKHEQLKCGV